MKITAIIGTYRKGGVIDSVVDEILAAAKEHGAEVEKVFLLDQRVEFCTNCRNCTQQEGTARGTCCLSDDMAAILDRIDASDGLILASPMNFGTVTALMKRFIERLVCYGYWPWGTGIPKERIRRKTKRAIVVASSARSRGDGALADRHRQAVEECCTTAWRPKGRNAVHRSGGRSTEGESPRERQSQGTKAGATAGIRVNRPDAWCHWHLASGTQKGTPRRAFLVRQPMARVGVTCGRSGQP